MGSIGDVGESADSFPAIYVELRSLRALMDERDQRYTERANAAGLALKDALAAQEKLAASVNESAREAINKAETAQRGVNERGNEFRGQLDDQAKLLMQRSEAQAEFGRIAQQFAEMKKGLDDYKATMAAEIRSLRESRSALSGAWMAMIAVSALVGAVGGFVLRALAGK